MASTLGEVALQKPLVDRTRFCSLKLALLTFFMHQCLAECRKVYLSRRTKPIRTLGTFPHGEQIRVPIRHFICQFFFLPLLFFFFYFNPKGSFPAPFFLLSYVKKQIFNFSFMEFRYYFWHCTFSQLSPLSNHVLNKIFSFFISLYSGAKKSTILIILKYIILFYLYIYIFNIIE